MIYDIQIVLVLNLKRLVLRRVCKEHSITYPPAL